VKPASEFSIGRELYSDAGNLKWQTCFEIEKLEVEFFMCALRVLQFLTRTDAWES